MMPVSPSLKLMSPTSLRVRRAGERSLHGVALALAACDDGAGEDITEQPAGVPASESPAELGRGAEGPRSPRHMHICVNTLLPQPRARQERPGWSPVVDAGRTTRSCST